MKKRLRTVTSLLLLLTLLTGCWQEETPEEEADVLPPMQEETAAKEDEPLLPERFALPYTPEQTLDPIACPDGMQQVAASLLYEGLFRLDGNFEPQLSLCISYTCDAEASRYVFTLREGVQFSDGTPLTGRDVRSSLERARQSEDRKSVV
mgnify:FL=1